jgi:DNA sulfur modification protein DndB
VVKQNKVLREMIEPEKSTLAPKSRKLFTLSAVHQANQALLMGLDGVDEKKTIKEFWDALLEAFPEWRQYSSSENRQEYISAYGTVLHALGRSANAYLRSAKTASWKRFIEAVREIDWSRNNRALWEGRALQAGHVSKSNQSVSLTAAVVKRQLGLALSAEETRYEEAIQGGRKR